MLIPSGLRIETSEFGWFDSTTQSKEDLISHGFEDAYGAYFAFIDPENMDLEKFPKWESVPWFYAELNEGDCIYIPLRWYHYVESDPEITITWHNWFNLANEWRPEDECYRTDDGIEMGKRFSTSECLYSKDKHGYRGNPTLWGAQTKFSSRCLPRNDTASL
jgi:hypothetical protein